MIIFSDLDGTFLDSETYDYQINLALVGQIRDQQIPLVFCTSKCHDETRYYLDLLGLQMPFIVENGGALYLPDEWRSRFWLADPVIRKPGMVKKEYGRDLSSDFGKLKELAAEFDLKLFTEMDVEELSALTGLSPHVARLAGRRHYDLPFALSPDRSEKLLPPLSRELNRMGLALQQGGKYLHITGAFSKADPVRELLEGDRHRSISSPSVIGLGDSPNDLEMLKLVDIPILIPRKDGSPCREITRQIRDLVISRYPAPRGWADTLEQVLMSAQGGLNV